MPTQEDAKPVLEKLAAAIERHAGPFDPSGFEGRVRAGEQTGKLFGWFERPGEKYIALPDLSMVSHETRIQGSNLVKVELWMSGQLMTSTTMDAPPDFP